MCSCFKPLDMFDVRGEKTSPSHSYVISEDKELVKVTKEGYEYTGMYIED